MVSDDAAERIEADGAVTTLELFFDLVFVFTITQLTSVIVEAPTWSSTWHVIVMLGLIFWMYDGYAWLTNAVPARGRRRESLLLGGMGGYLVLAISITHAFDGDGLTFGLAYLVITAIHAYLYVRAAGAGSAAAMRELAPWNLLAASAVCVGGALGGRAEEVIWTVVFLLLWFATRASPLFELRPAHFVERHGLLVLVAIGESIVATGIAARGLPLDLSLVIVVILGLMLSAGLWWTYFGGGEGEVDAAFERSVGADRVRLAFTGFGYAHYGMLLGIVFTAVGLRKVVGDPGGVLRVEFGVMLAGGAALFLAADGWFRWLLGLRQVGVREIGAIALLLAVPAGRLLSAVAALIVTVVLLLSTVAFERRGGDTAGGDGRSAPLA